MKLIREISTSEFIAAAIEADRRDGWASTKGVRQSLGEDVPFKSVCIKLMLLDKANIMEGCPCGCSSPMWLVDGTIGDEFGVNHPNAHMNYLVSWDDADRVRSVATGHGVTP